MLPLAAGRRAVIRDLDATIAILRGLSPAERERGTSCEGWDVRQLAAHIAETTRTISTRLTEYLHQRTDETPTLDAPREPNPGAAWNDILARITNGRNQLATVLAHLEEDDLDRTMDETHSCRRMFNYAALEFGLHRSDIEAALGKPGGVNVETVQASDFLYGQRLAELAEKTLPKGPGVDPFALRLRGDDLIDLWLAWNGTSWSVHPGDVPVTTVRGSDSAVVLYVMGRIPLTDRRLDVTGNRKIAGRFKAFVPGP